MPGYVGKYVRMAEAIEEIARVHFGGDSDEADANLLLALQDKVLSVLSEETHVGVLSIEDHPLFWVSKHHWQGSRSILSRTSWRRNCLLRRKDLLEIYEGLWETKEPGRGESAAPAPEPEPEATTEPKPEPETENNLADEGKLIKPGSKEKRQAREPKPQTVAGWKTAHDEINRFQKLLKGTLEDAAKKVAADSDRKASDLLRDRRRYIVHQKAAKRQK